MSDRDHVIPEAEMRLEVVARVAHGMGDAERGVPSHKLHNYVGWPWSTGFRSIIIYIYGRTS